jgi:hypothetical protein
MIRLTPVTCDDSLRLAIIHSLAETSAHHVGAIG